MQRSGLNVCEDLSSSELRILARKEKDGRVSLRLLAIANVLDGLKREDAARQSGMTRQTLRDWVLRYNASGVDGLRDRPRGHSKRELTPEQEAEFEQIVLKGPEGKLVRWRRVDLRDVIKEKFGVEYHERSVGKILHRLGFSHISARPVHPKADIQAQEDFKKLYRPGASGSS